MGDKTIECISIPHGGIENISSYFFILILDTVGLFKKRLKTHLFIEAFGCYFMLYFEAL